MKKNIFIFFFLFHFLGCTGSLDKDPGNTLKEIYVKIGSSNRKCLIHPPLNEISSKIPLYIVLHGAGGTPQGLVNLTKSRFNELSNLYSFYVAYPEGLKRTWNDFRNDSSTYAHRKNINDVQFISALIDQFLDTFSIDKNRIFIIGMSNGGFMAFRLACELSSKICGIAVVAATNPIDQDKSCYPVQPLDIIILNGTDDPIVPYNGGSIKLFGRNRGIISSTDQTILYWKHFNNCPDNPDIFNLPDSDPYDGTKTQRKSYGPCQNNTRVELYTIHGGGHTWPGGLQYLSKIFIGKTSHDIDACDIIYNFFSRKNEDYIE